jgi:hypothetical protein
MRTLYIHCGLPKTGTTSIQKFLASSRNELRANGYDYPNIAVNDDRTAHHNLAREILHDEQFDPEKGTSTDFFNYLEGQERCPKVILSSEGLTHCLLRDPVALFDFVRQMIARNDEVFIIFTFRKFWKISESSFLYDLRSGKAGEIRTNPARVPKTTKWLKKLAAGLTELRELVGADRFMACDTEKSGGDSVAAFCKLLGIAQQRQPDGGPRFNKRVGLKKAALLYKTKQLSSDSSEALSMTPRQVTRVRRRILAIPDFPGEIFDYRLISFEDANAIQSVARSVLPQFLVRDLDQSLQSEITPYEAADLQKVILSREDIEAVRAAVPDRLSSLIPWLGASETVSGSRGV